MRIANLSDIEEFEQTPAETRWRGKSTYELIANSAARFADRPALKFQQTSELDEAPQIVTYQELIAKINQTANALFRAGVSIGGTTSLILPNLLETHFSIWGAEALGITAPVNYMLEPAALRDIIVASNAEALIVFGPASGFRIWEKALSIVDTVPNLKVIVQVNLRSEDKQIGETPGGIPILDFKDLLSAENSHDLDFDRSITSQDIAAYFHTGGTTGTPKLAQHSHANQVHLSSIMADMHAWDENSVAICGLPMFHVNSIFCTGLNIIACGGQVILLTPNGFRAPGVINNLWRLVEKYKANFFSSVPTIISSLLSIPIDGADISSIDFVFCGAAPISPEVFRQFQETTGVNILEGYGMTESTCVSSSNPLHGEKRIGSIGLRLPYQEMKCVLLDESMAFLRDCKIDEPGIVVIKGPSVFAGYKQVEKNKDAFIDDWFISGDLARQDADGYFWMTGRSKDLIIRGGHNIDPKSIEDALSKHPSIALVAAIGQPDAYAGELPCLYLTLKDERTGPVPTTDGLILFAKEHIVERAAAPTYIEIVDSMPLTAVGKIFKPTLRKWAVQRVLSQAAKDVDPSASVKVVDDERTGIRVDVATSEFFREEIVQTLGQFTIAYRVSS